MHNSDAGSEGLTFDTFKGVASGGSYGSALPPQAIPLHKKNDKWKKSCMDRLEEIGLSQLRYNIKFNDLYSMVEGNLAYTDYEAPPDSMKGLVERLEAEDIPAYVKHYDVLGQLANHLSGKYNDVKDKFRVDFLDPISINEFDRDLTNRLLEFSQQAFQTEFELTMLKKGIEIDKQFETEEEQQQYMQFLEEQKKMTATPPEIYSSMKREWKPQAAKWAEATLENDIQRFNIAEMDREFFLDKFLTGRWFKHYRVGYDYYKPERWSPITTFFSQDLDIKYPQDGEFIGRIHYMSPSDIVNVHGYLLTEREQKSLLNAFDFVGNPSESTSDEPGFQKLIESGFSEYQLLPGQDYYAREANVVLQDALGTPLGEETFFNSDGEAVTRPAWIPSYRDQADHGNRRAANLRRDIDVRKDTLRVVEAYFRSFERIGVLYYETKSGIMAKEFVTDEILDGFLKDKGIKTLRKISLDELEKKEKTGELEPNTICFTYAPRVYKGLKICASHGYLEKDLYFVDPNPYQIKGDSNLYDVKLPVAGLITTAEAAKLRPYQIEYNYQMNLMHSLTEKEIGMFFLFDVNFLTSDFAEMGDSREALLNVVDMARSIGIVPIDGSKQNMREKQGMQFNTMMAQDISFTPQIQLKMQMAEYYKRLMLEQIGVTAQDMGTPSEYATAEGIKVGQQNSFSQIEHIFEKMDNSRLKDLEIHLSVAQYCQANEKDISVNYTRSDGELQLLQFSDEWFHHRKFGLLPIADSKKRKELQIFKEFLLQNNTFSNDLVDYAKVLTSDSMTTVVNELKKSQEKRDGEIQAQREHEQGLADKQQETILAKEKMQEEAEAKEKDLDRENKLEVARIAALGRAIDNNATQSGIDQINKAADRSQRETESQLNFALKDREISRKEEMDKEKLQLEAEKIEQEAEKIRLKREQMEHEKFVATVNKN
jgi:CRISPR/Cas system-associated protein endoribonuclease Cas2